jgi:hypothetical protein
MDSNSYIHVDSFNFVHGSNDEMWKHWTSERPEIKLLALNVYALNYVVPDFNCASNVILYNLKWQLAMILDE